MNFFNGLTPIKPRHLLIVFKSDARQLNISSALMTSSLSENCEGRLREVALSSERSPKAGRQGRSTADATQLFVRLQEDAELLQSSDPEYKNDSNTNRAQAILLDLKKAYHHINRPMLWAILSKHELLRSTINQLKGLHEYTSYRVKGQDGESTEYIPKEG